MHFIPLILPVIVGAILIPGPSGPYGVALRVHPLTDTSRRDPLDPTGLSASRRLLTSVFFPVERHHCRLVTVPYMTPPVAAYYGQQAAGFGISPTFYSDFDMEFCKPPSKPLELIRGRFPLVLFDPGLGESRLMYSAMARSLASEGYVVVTVDHPFEACAVQFPDGTVIPGINTDDPDDALLAKILSVRTRDISFVIDRLASRPVMFGHSLGGATAASVLHADERLLGGLNLDGMLVGPTMTTDVRKPFALVGRLGHEREDPTWDRFWPRLRGSRAQVAINNTLHGAYKDIPLLLSLVDLPDQTRREIESEIGSIDPVELDTDLMGILRAFFDLVLHNRTAPLQNLAHSFTNVSIVRSNL